LPAYFLDILDPHYDALLVANGAPLARALYSHLRRRAEHLVALDGGVNVLFKYKSMPDIVAGDLDSAAADALAWAKGKGATIKRLPSQESPDFAKGCELCRELGMTRVLVAGFSGHRTDHVLASLGFAVRMRGMNVTLVTDDIVAFPLHGRVERDFCVPNDHIVSWFAFPQAGPCSLTGVRWPFRNRTLRSEGFHSLSNQPAAPSVHVSQRAGHSIFMVSLRPQARAVKG
jgi:thiamine pyrophosphokinase